MKLMVGSIQNNIEGGRSFFAAPASTCWSTYSQIDPSQRHWYELIRESHPCHLSVDLEFLWTDFPGLDGAAMVVTLLEAVHFILESTFNIRRSNQYESVYEFDSTTADKFSRHLIIPIEQCAWRDNREVEAFVQLVMNHMRSHRLDQPAYQCMFNGIDDKSCFVDLAVYTANRNFRLFFQASLE